MQYAHILLVTASLLGLAGCHESHVLRRGPFLDASSPGEHDAAAPRDARDSGAPFAPDATLSEDVGDPVPPTADSAVPEAAAAPVDGEPVAQPSVDAGSGANTDLERSTPACEQFAAVAGASDNCGYAPSCADVFDRLWQKCQVAIACAERHCLCSDGNDATCGCIDSCLRPGDSPCRSLMVEMVECVAASTE